MLGLHTVEKLPQGLVAALAVAAILRALVAGVDVSRALAPARFVQVAGFGGVQAGVARPGGVQAVCAGPQGGGVHA